jgi:parallel beta-helix repeat protein
MPEMSIVTPTPSSIYAVFPVCSRDGVIERIHAEGTRDGAIYVGDSWDVVVADNHVSASTAGIEIENSIGITVVGNQAVGNTAGIAVFSLPGLPVTATANVLVADNTVTNNNLPNPIPFGSGAVGSIPTGTGILAVATQDTLITNNRVNRNDSGGIAVLAFSMPSGDPRFDPLPTNTVVSDNTVSSNGAAPDQVRSPVPGADLIHDGSGSGNCFEDNRFATSFPAGIEVLFACPEGHVGRSTTARRSLKAGPRDALERRPSSFSSPWSRAEEDSPTRAAWRSSARRSAK